MKTSMKKKFKQTLAMLFAVALVFTSIPQTAYAAEPNSVEATEVAETEVVETTESAESVEVVEEAEEVVEIEEGVDLAAEGESRLVAFVNDGNVTVSENAESATEGTDYTFKAVANEGYENVTVAAYTTATYALEEKTSVAVTGPVDDVYTIAGSALTEDITIVVSATAKAPAEPETYAVTFVNNESVTVTENAANATAGEAYTFKAVAAEGYENVTVTAYTTATYALEEKTSVEVTGPVEDVYTVASVTEAITVVVSATAKAPAEPVVTTYAVTEVAEGATIAYVDGCVADGKIAEGTDLKFTVAVTDAENKEVKAVTYKVGDAEAAEVTATEGVYTVAKEKITADVTLTVELQDKAPAVPMYTVTFADAEGASVSDVKVDGEAVEVVEGILPSVSANTIVAFGVNAEITHKVTAVKTVVGETEETITPVDNVYSVTVTADVTIKVETEKLNKLTIEKEENTDYHSFYVVVPGDNGGESGLVPGDCAYRENKEFTIQVVPKAGYQVDEVFLYKGDIEEGQWNEDWTVKLNPTVTFTEDLTEITVRVKTSVISREVDATVVFANEADNMTYTVSGNNFFEKVPGKSNTYNVYAGGRYVDFKVTASGAYEPVVVLNDNLEKPLEGTKGATSKGKTLYTYRVLAATLAEYNVIKIKETIADQTVSVSYKYEEVELGIGSINGVATIPESSETADGGVATDIYKVPYGATITLTATAKDNCKITKAATTVGTGRAKNEKIKNNAVTFSVKATANANTVVESEKLYAVTVSGKSLKAPVKGVYNVEWVGSEQATAEIAVRYGAGLESMATIKAVDLKDSKKKAAASKFVAEGTEAALTLDKADAGKTLVATVTADDGTEAGKKFTVKFKVAPLASKVTVTGVKSGKLSQAADTTKEYALTYNPKGVSNIYDVKVESAKADATEQNHTAAQSAVWAEIVNGKLVVTTSQTVAEDVAKLIIYNTKTGDALTNGTFNVTITDSTLTKITPTVKLKSSNDVELTLTLGAKKVEDPKVGEVYYKVEVTSAAADKDEAVKNAIANPFYFVKSGDSQEETIKVNTADFGSVHKAVKYNVKVTLVQTKDTSLPGEDNVVATSKTASKNNLATKAAYYETSLKLKKGKTTVYTGESNVVVATAQFSKNTTYTSLSYVTPNAGNVVATIGPNNQILVNVLENAYPGKYTVTATATAPGGAVASKASVTINVVKSISKIDISVPSDKVYKQNGKAATVTAKAYFNDDSHYQPKTKKVTWSIVDADGNPFVGKISVKNGKVTIAKDFVLSKDETENQFKVRATAADRKGNAVYGESALLTVKASAVALGDLILVEEVRVWNDDIQQSVIEGYKVIGGSGTTLTTTEIYNLKAAVLNKGEIEKENYTPAEFAAATIQDVTFSVSNKAVRMYANGEIDSVTKPAKNVKITATATDGSKKKAVLSNLSFVYPKINDLCIAVYNTKGWENAVPADPTKPTELTYSANTGDVLEVSLYDNLGEGYDWAYINGPINHSFKIKSGATLYSNDSMYGSYRIIPTAKETVLELKDKANNVTKVYKLTNTSWSETAAPEVTTSDKLYSGYYPEAQPVVFKVADAEKYIGKSVRVTYDRIQYEKDSKYTNFIHYLMDYNDEITTKVGEDGTFSLTWKDGYDDNAYTNLVKGNYKLYFTFGTEEITYQDEDYTETAFKAETKTTSATVKVVNPSVKASKFTPNTSYKIYVKDGLSVKLTGRGQGVDMSTLQFGDLKNVNVNGQSNKFTDYFALERNAETGKYFIKLLDNVNVDDIKASDLKGYVSYYVQGDSILNSDCNGTFQIKITLEKSRTSQAYALSNLTVTGNTISGNKVSGNVFAYVGGKVENKVNVNEVYSASDKFVVTAEDGSVTLENAKDLAAGDYTVEAYIITDDNRYDYKIAQMKQAYLNETDEAKKAELKTAYENAIKAHGVKVKTKVSLREPVAPEVPEVTNYEVLVAVEEGATLTYVGDVTPDEAGKIAENTALKFKVELTDENKEVDSVMYSMGEAENVVLEAAEDVYTTPAVTANITITVTLKDKTPAAPEVTVTSVAVNPETATVVKGGNATFTATVTLSEGEDTDGVTWTVTGTENEGTTIVDGLLTVAADETATELTVTATSVKDNSKSATATVTVTEATPEP